MLRNTAFIVALCISGMLFSVNLFAKDSTAITRLSQVERLTVSSDQFKEPAEFIVTLPPSYGKKSDKEYVVLLDFHPRSQAYLSGMHDWMSHNGDWPWLETIIVTAPDGHAGLGELKVQAIEEQGSDLLLDFMEQELLPAIDKKYRTNGFRILNGFTGNGGLTLYTLLNRPSLFNAYFAASPVLSRDFAYVIKDAPKKLAAMKGKPRFLLMSTSDSGFEQRQLASFAEMESIIKSNANELLDHHIKRFDGSYYMTQPILATAYGIELLFNDIHQVLKPDSEISSRGAQAILEYYRYLSDEKYGFEVPATDSLIALAKAESSRDAVKGLVVYQLAVEAAPESHTAHHALANAYAEMEEFELAIRHEQLALDNTDHPFWTKRYSESLAAYKDKKRL
ncbi:alpha/beta hydrolase-fold protein [uncultured Shewanella sp.]|uniref:alpha/beta hydrolase-fold protein n=1 Tax=Shewanella atlantica TaxID=271099 RepID=UPI002603D65F|nr:alpha/beta hydrolase-fold protein [uncultured Shewanella sp.]